MYETTLSLYLAKLDRSYEKYAGKITSQELQKR